MTKFFTAFWTGLQDLQDYKAANVAQTFLSAGCEFSACVAAVLHLQNSPTKRVPLASHSWLAPFSIPNFLMKLTTTILAIALASSIAHSATYYRNDATTGVGTPTNLGNVNYWSVGTTGAYVNPSVLPGSNDTVVWWAKDFTSNNTSANNTINSDVSWYGIEIDNFNNGTTGTALTIGGSPNTITLGFGGINTHYTTIQNGGLTVSANIKLDCTQTWFSGTSGTSIGIAVSGQLDLNGYNLTIGNRDISTTKVVNNGNTDSLFTVTGGRINVTLNNFSTGTNNKKITVVLAGTSTATIKFAFAGTTASYMSTADTTNIKVDTSRFNATSGAPIFDNFISFQSNGQRNVIYSGAITGTGNLILDMNLAPIAGSTHGSSFTLPNDNLGFTGCMQINGSTVSIDSTLTGFFIGANNALGTGGLTIGSTPFIWAYGKDVIISNSSVRLLTGFVAKGSNTLGFSGAFNPTSATQAITITNKITNVSSGEDTIIKELQLTGGIGRYTEGAATANTALLTFNGPGTTRVGVITSLMDAGANDRRVAVVEGTLILDGANTYRGTTTVGAVISEVTYYGKLFVNGSITGHATTGIVTINEGCSLGGIGTISAPIILATGADFIFANTNHLTIASSLSLGTAWTLTLEPSATWQLDTWRKVFSYGSLIGSEIAPIIVDNTSRDDWDWTSKFESNALWVQATAIPEPAAFALLGVSLLVVTVLRRKK